MVFTPDGQLAIVSDPWDATLSSYRLDSGGALTPVSTATTGGWPQYVALDESGKFAYVADNNNSAVLEYAISPTGTLTATGSVPSNGYSPLALAVSHGFLYCADGNSNSIAQFSINPANGVLTLVQTYQTGSEPQEAGPLWISIDPTGTYLYAGSLPEIAEFIVNANTGVLTNNGTIQVPNGAMWGGIDPSGRFLFTAGVVNGTISQFIIGSSGTLTPNGSVSLGPNTVTATLAFAQR